MKHNIHELKSKYIKEQDTTRLTMDFLPLEFDITSAEGGAIIDFVAKKAFKIYSGNLSDAEFKKYRKEITALCKDFDDIYSEINKKYGLNEQD